MQEDEQVLSEVMGDGRQDGQAVLWEAELHDFVGRRGQRLDELRIEIMTLFEYQRRIAAHFTTAVGNGDPSRCMLYSTQGLAHPKPRGHVYFTTIHIQLGRRMTQTQSTTVTIVLTYPLNGTN